LKSRQPEIRLGDADESRALLAGIALRIGQMMEPVCSGASFDEGVTLRFFLAASYSRKPFY
jgi:hypothetical protein